MQQKTANALKFRKQVHGSWLPPSPLGWCGLTAIVMTTSIAPTRSLQIVWQIFFCSMCCTCLPYCFWIANLFLILLSPSKKHKPLRGAFIRLEASDKFRLICKSMFACMYPPNSPCPSRCHHVFDTLSTHKKGENLTILSLLYGAGRSLSLE